MNTTEADIQNIRQQLAQLPPEVLERIHDALRHHSIAHAGSLLWKAGVGLSSADTYEYRMTLFPPGAMVDPYTAGPPLLQPSTCLPEPEPVTPASTSAGYSGVPPQPVSDVSGRDLHQARQQLVHLLSARAASDLRPPTSDLLSDLRDLIQRHVILPPMAAETLALWVVHTHAFTLREVTTYIGVVSPEKRCGKTTLLELLGLLAHEAIAAANISPSALFRVIEEARPTLIIDEADTFMQARDEIAGILNAGYRKGNSYVVRVAESKSRKQSAGRTSYTGGTSYTSPPSPAIHPPIQSSTGLMDSGINGLVPRKPVGTSDSPSPIHSSTAQPMNPTIQQSNNPHSSIHPAIHSSIKPSIHHSGLVRFSCWCPKVMAAIGRLPDTLADRCILITMQRKMPGEKCSRLRELDATPYRQRCADFVRDHTDAIARARPDIPSALNDRAADIWEPLLAIADLAGGEWPALARRAAEELSTSCDDDITLMGYLLKDLRNYMVLKNVDRVLSRDLVAYFNPRHDRPWEDLRRGRDINEWWLGRRLSELGIRARAIRTGDNVAKGYFLADVEPAFRRYVANPELHAAQPPKTL